MLKLYFYVPASHLDAVKTALFNAGAGRIGCYDQCAWQTLGQGQFRPLKGANPVIGAAPLGDVGTLETVAEYQVEMVLEEHNLKTVIAALRQAHPYEEPAFGVLPLLAI